MIDVTIPNLGESVSEGTIARWTKQSGDWVDTDQVLLELETDKAAMEIAATGSGVLEIVAAAGSTVPVGALVARIDTSKAKPAGGAAAPAAAPAPVAAAAPVAAPVAAPAPVAPPAPAPTPPAPVAKAPAPVAAPAPAAAAQRPTMGGAPTIFARPASPSLRRWAREQGVDAAALARAAATPPVVAPPAGAVAVAPHLVGVADTERVPMTTLRKRIAERLVEAQRTAAILTTFNEVDLSAVMALRKKHKDRFKEVHGVDLGFMSWFGRAVIEGLADVPQLNASIEGTDIVYHRHVHLGVAVSTERGLVVPVVRNAEQMGFAELEGAIGELAKLGRDNKLKPDHLVGGTFSISNGGVFGSLLSTPILNPPQSGILGMHKIQERPVVVDGQIVIRPMMYVAMSYDHRLVDGKEAVTFLVRVKERLEDPTRLLLGV
jgi:2-oxoglutarate dehydrogenase E2 component (dihydrolipoamide succinyltransferase)